MGNTYMLIMLTAYLRAVKENVSNLCEYSVVYTIESHNCNAAVASKCSLLFMLVIDTIW